MDSPSCLHVSVSVFFRYQKTTFARRRRVLPSALSLLLLLPEVRIFFWSAACRCSSPSPSAGHAQCFHCSVFRDACACGDARRPQHGVHRIHDVALLSMQEHFLMLLPFCLLLAAVELATGAACSVHMMRARYARPFSLPAILSFSRCCCCCCFRSTQLHLHAVSCCCCSSLCRTKQ